MISSWLVRRSSTPSTGAKCCTRTPCPTPPITRLPRWSGRGVSQNIDGLHQKAGSRNVLELHGSVHRNFCMDCREAYSLQQVLESKGEYPRCSRCGGVVKPDVVLYQESLDMDLLQRAAMYIKQADVLIVAGTSLTVQPAAGLVRLYEGDKFILINKSATPMDGMADYLISDSVAKVLGMMVGGERL